MKGKVLLHCLLFALGILCTQANVAFAVSPSAISVDVNPPNPAPNQSVTITLSSFAANLDTVNIVWLVDGKMLSSGTGQKSFSLTAKGANVETKVEARIFLPDGQIDKRVTIKPGVLVLLWQATDSYVPPFYRGKALPTLDSEIKVVAMPEIVVNNVKVSPNNMTYAWKQNYQNMQNESGYGKNFFTYVNDYLENLSNISVVASTTNGLYTSEANTNIQTQNPEILFYRRGTNGETNWDQALPDGHLIQDEEIIIAEPYFLSKNWQAPNFLYYWSVNNRTVDVPSYRKNLLPVRAGGVSGKSTIKLEVENTEKIFQTSTKELNVQF